MWIVSDYPFSPCQFLDGHFNYWNQRIVRHNFPDYCLKVSPLFFLLLIQANLNVSPYLHIYHHLSLSCLCDNIPPVLWGVVWSNNWEAKVVIIDHWSGLAHLVHRIIGFLLFLWPWLLRGGRIQAGTFMSILFYDCLITRFKVNFLNYVSRQFN